MEKIIHDTKTSIVLRDQFGKHFDRYCAIRKAENLSTDSLQREYETHLHLWRYLKAEGFQGDELAVTKEMIQAYAKGVFQDPDLKHNTARNRIYRLRHFYREAERQEWIFVNPMNSIKIPKIEENPITVLTVKQMKDLMKLPNLNSAKGIRDRTMMELYYSCAFRLSELMQLTDEHFFDDYRRVRIRGKGQKEAVLPVGKIAAHLLKFYIRKIFPKINVKHTKQIFISVLTGNPMNRHIIYSALRIYFKQLIPDRTMGMHVFRYSVATHLADEGVDIRLLQEFMRHDKPSTTERYIKRTFQQLQESIETHIPGTKKC
jgi:integrase/recombinase XerD